MKRLLLPLIPLMLLSGCGSPRPLAGGGDSSSDKSDGYMSGLETSSIQHVNVKDDMVTYRTFEDYVRSHVSGVDVGSDGNLVIRGISSFNASTKPLILLDGMEVLNTHEINPSEIHSVDVLKDASSTASYGMRGANGVILITTKAAQHAKQAEKDAKRAARKAKRKR